MLRTLVAALSLSAALTLGAALSLGLTATLSYAEDIVPEPEGYRMDAYRAPVPDTLEGVTVVDDNGAYALWKTGAVVFVDVLPRPPKPKLPKGTIYREKPRKSIPGAIWLPNIGYGAIADVTEDYFRRNLRLATNSDADKPVLFFCLIDCWMSWNAAKRAREEFGYLRVFWYPGGTDGWSFEDFPLEKVERVPFGQ